MQVNFNNLRKKLIADYNILVTKLNQAVVEDVDMNRVVEPVENLRRVMDNIRDSIVTIGCLEENGNSDCQCVLTDNLTVKIFAPEDGSEEDK
jgi:hypothetical protein